MNYGYGKTKYHNHKVTIDGITFDSKKEAVRWKELVLMQKAGQISDLQRQVKIELIPSQRNAAGALERAVNYIADFVYNKDGQTVYEDTKGFRTADYIIKRKLCLFLKGITITEL